VANAPTLANEWPIARDHRRMLYGMACVSMGVLVGSFRCGCAFSSGNVSGYAHACQRQGATTASIWSVRNQTRPMALDLCRAVGRYTYLHCVYDTAIAQPRPRQPAVHLAPAKN